jgi:hypothetical protein
MAKAFRFIGRLIGWTVESAQAAGEIERIKQVLEDARAQIRLVESQPPSADKEQRLANIVMRSFLEIETSVQRLRQILRNK